MLNKNRVVIFDFDGVLVNSFQQVYLINSLAAKAVSRMMTEEDFRRMFYGRFHQKLHNFLDLSDGLLEEFISYKHSIYNKIYSQARLYDFAPELINGLGHQAALYIISSASQPAVTAMLKRNNLAGCFTEIANIGTEGKVKKILDCVNSIGASLDSSYFITDTVGDVIDGREAGIKTIAVTWGFHDSQDLALSEPTFMAGNYQEVLEFISNDK